MPHLQNQLLSRWPRTSSGELHGRLRTVELAQGQVISEPHGRTEMVYFPHSGIISCVVDFEDGPSIETAMVGRDGQYGAGQALGQRLSLGRATVQVEGRASVIGAEALRAIAQKDVKSRQLLIDYEQFHLAQVQQTAACNAAHDLRQRICRWLLRMHGLVGDDLPLTQEYLAQMMGVRRSSVSTTAGDLQRRGLISYRRGRVQIVDLENIRRLGCECDRALRSHYRALFTCEEVLAVPRLPALARAAFG